MKRSTIIIASTLIPATLASIAVIVPLMIKEPVTSPAASLPIAQVKEFTCDDITHQRQQLADQRQALASLKTKIEEGKKRGMNVGMYEVYAGMSEASLDSIESELNLATELKGCKP